MSDRLLVLPVAQFGFAAAAIDSSDSAILGIVSDQDDSDAELATGHTAVAILHTSPGTASVLLSFGDQPLLMLKRSCLSWEPVQEATEEEQLENPTAPVAMAAVDSRWQSVPVVVWRLDHGWLEAPRHKGFVQRRQPLYTVVLQRLEHNLV